ncbi:TetR-like C-terminal domain-containing protein [Microbacterium sp. NPDC076895]|uniref:TetR/AcrR family transcriptional regulator n=1 Tax=Microbacterium sp. NPDC076895 TaxID=3154957 RepID=UPI00343B132C
MSESREPWRDDPRAARVAGRLRRVVLDLAEERPIAEIGVAEISRLAGISRSTFYKHAASPARLLKSVLTEELLHIANTVQTRLRSGEGDLRALTRDGLGAVLDHVRAHEQIYRLALSETGSPELHRLLADHFRQSVLLVFQLSHLQAPPLPRTSPEPDDTWELFAAFVGGAYAEVITVWLREPTPRTPESVIDILLAALPAWMLHPRPSPAVR